MAINDDDDVDVNDGEENENIDGWEKLVKSLIVSTISTVIN